MANTVNSPNMSLPVPQVGVDPGPQFAIDINACLAILDAHDHTIGSGVQITPAGLNINATLSLGNNILSNIASLTLTPQIVTPGINSIYEAGVDLYYVDGNGNDIRITQSGSVVGSPGTITGLPSGTASATFAAGTFTFQSATNTAANVDGGSFVFRNNVALSNGLTLSPPNAMGANYTLILPSIPASNNVMTLDSSGNMGSVTYNAVGQTMTSTGANAIGVSMTSTGANAIASKMTLTGANSIIAVSSNANFPGNAVQENGRNVVVSNNNATSSLAIVRAGFDSLGQVIYGEGISFSNHTGTGVYDILYLTPFADVAVVQVTIISPAAGTATLVSPGASGTQIRTANGVGTPTDLGFTIIAIGQRA